MIIITHGTDTMAETARVLVEKIRDKTIVLTGAMIPYKFGSSDVLFCVFLFGSLLGLVAGCCAISIHVLPIHRKDNKVFFICYDFTVIN